MKTNFSMLFYMKKQKNYACGDSPIHLRITINGNRVKITTGQEYKPKHWKPKTGRLTGTKEDTKRFNAYLDNLQALVYRAHKDLAQAGSPITAESIRNKFQGKDTTTHTLLEALRNYNRKMKALVGKHYSIGTLKRFEILERHLQAFMLENTKPLI